jgi:mono/diheme cytochrome c family protein
MRRIMKWLGVGAGSIAGVAMLALGANYGISAQRIAQTYSITPAALTVPADSAGLALGRHMATAIGKCAECHGTRYEGKVFLEDPLLGRISAPNITPAGVTRDYTDADWVRAVRHGVKPDGRSVVVMPSYEFYNYGDEDLAAVVAYMKSLAPVEHTPPSIKLGPMGRLLITANMFPVLAAEVIDHDAPHPVAPAVAPTADYGRYIASIGCVGCHGPALQGGVPPADGPDISPSGRTAGWSQDDFRLALRAGKRPDGTIIDIAMPWNMTAGMTDTEIAAVWQYLQSLQPSPVARAR